MTLMGPDLDIEMDHIILMNLLNLFKLFTIAL
jgi:hypothetical protein